MSDEHESHGHSVAAWVCVTLLIIGFALGSLAVALLNVPLAIGGVIVCIIGLVDDAPRKHGTRIGGLPVLGPTADLPHLVRAIGPRQ